MPNNHIKRSLNFLYGLYQNNNIKLILYKLDTSLISILICFTLFKTTTEQFINYVCIELYCFYLVLEFHKVNRSYYFGVHELVVDAADDKLEEFENYEAEASKYRNERKHVLCNSIVLNAFLRKEKVWTIKSLLLLNIKCSSRVKSNVFILYMALVWRPYWICNIIKERIISILSQKVPSIIFCLDEIVS